jgi:hypothetical protein
MTQSPDTRYFYMAGGERCGPYTLEQMLQQSVHQKTPVWIKGVGDWRTAEDVQELAGLIPPAPPENDSKPPAYVAPGNEAMMLPRYAKALRELNLGLLVLIFGTFTLASLGGTAFRFSYLVAALVWSFVLYRAARAVPERRPWLWAIFGIAPLIGYVPLILLHNKLKRPLEAAGFRISFLGRATPPAKTRH